MTARSSGKGPRVIWDTKLSGMGERVMSKQKFVELYGLGKKTCCMIAGSIFIHLLILLEI